MRVYYKTDSWLTVRCWKALPERFGSTETEQEIAKAKKSQPFQAPKFVHANLMKIDKVHEFSNLKNNYGDDELSKEMDKEEIKLDWKR